MFNNERNNTMQEQQFDIGMYFTIKYYADKHSKTITRRGQFTKECEYGITKYMVIHISDTLILTQMELDVRLKHGRY